MTLARATPIASILQCRVGMLGACRAILNPAPAAFERCSPRALGEAVVNPCNDLWQIAGTSLRTLASALAIDVSSLGTNPLAGLRSLAPNHRFLTLLLLQDRMALRCVDIAIALFDLDGKGKGIGLGGYIPHSERGRLPYEGALVASFGGVAQDL